MRAAGSRLFHAGCNRKASTLISRSCGVLIAVFCVITLLLAASQAFADRGYGGHGYYGGGGHYGGHGYYRGGGYYRGHGYYGGGIGLGLYYGSPYWGASWGYPYYPYYYPSYPAYSPYYYGPEVTIESSPPVYIERGQKSEPSNVPAIWFYCPDSRKYYPYVKECPGGWQSVPAQPPAPER